jgi:phenylalanyl-tRNA synthetase beta chain
VARDIAVLYGLELADGPGESGAEALANGEKNVSEVASLEIVDAVGCPRYALAVVEGVNVGPSPDWLAAHLTAIGVRPVNNVVDVTNFVLQDVGQPLHAFDLDKLGSSVVVRSANDGETIVGIDHKEYELTEADLVIANAEGPVAIAGVMGGEATEVTDETTRVLIECAYFDPTRVRKGSKRHGLHTESSHRFERGIDPNGIVRHLEMAVELLLLTQDGLDAEPRVRKGTIEEYPTLIEPTVIEYATGLYGRIMGDDVDASRAQAILEGLGLDVAAEGETWRVTVPTYRPDLERPIDLVEEIGRVIGFDVVEPKLPRAPMGEAHGVRDDARHGETIVGRELLRERVDRRALLTSQGLREVVNYSFMSAAELDRLDVPAGDPLRDVVEVANPLTKDQAFMRTTLLPSLLRVLEHNVQRRRPDVAIFEFGRTFHQDGERERLGVLLTGPRRKHFSEAHDWDFFDMKGLLEGLLLGRDIEGSWAKPDDLTAHLHPGIQAEWTLGNHVVGRAGYLHPNVVADLELDAPVVVAEIDLGALDEAGVRVSKYVAQGRYPASSRDFAFLVDTQTSWGQISEAIEAFAEHSEDGDLLRSVEVFDLYEGDQVPDGKRSLAITVVYRSDDRTLTDEEIARLDEGVVAHLADAVGAHLR